MINRNFQKIYKNITFPVLLSQVSSLSFVRFQKGWLIIQFHVVDVRLNQTARTSVKVVERARAIAIRRTLLSAFVERLAWSFLLSSVGDVEASERKSGLPASIESAKSVKGPGG